MGYLDAALEFVSATAVPATLSLVRPGGTVCFVGALTGQWTIPDFSPFSIPTGVRLTSYSGTAQDLPTTALDQYLSAIEAGTVRGHEKVPTGGQFGSPVVASCLSPRVVRRVVIVEALPRLTVAVSTQSPTAAEGDLHCRRLRGNVWT